MEEIFVPAMGMAMEDAVLVEWLKEPGDQVAPGEAVALIETDKSTIELTSSAAGTLGRQRAAAGETVQVGALLALVIAEGEQEPAEDDAPEAAAAPVAVAAPATQSSSDDERAPHRLSPRQRREQAAAQEATSAQPAARADGFQAAMAAAVSESWATMPHFTVAREVGAASLLDAYRAAREVNADVTVTDLLLRALARATGESGQATALGLAVATDWGVLIPTVSVPADHSLDAIAAARREAVDAARARRLRGDDGAAPWITLSNLGPMGVTWFTGVIPLGQRALLTTGSIVERPAVRDGHVVAESQLWAAITSDHRSLDGAAAAQILDRFTAGLAS